ncbi:ZN397 protein, partial [Ptilonorhynchus violaceus]|nr:ZN397 protein [Ptilonorhynchus violaceus]
SLLSPGKCQDCGKTSAFPKRRRSQKCPECGKCFRPASSLLSQPRGKKPYKCPECGKSFGMGSASVQRQRIRPGAAPCQGGFSGKSFPGSPGS